MCAAELNDGALICWRTDAHEPHHGCCYTATGGGIDAEPAGGDS